MELVVVVAVGLVVVTSSLGFGILLSASNLKNLRSQLQEMW